MTFSHRSPARAEALGIYPCLTYRDVRRAINWLQTAFGIQGQALAPPQMTSRSTTHCSTPTAGPSSSSQNAPTNYTARTPAGDGST